MKQVRAPFTKEQCESFNEFQKVGFFHPFTCGGNHSEHVNLVADESGLHCPECDYCQNWAWDFQLNGEWKSVSPESWFPKNQ